mgnify:CR=1 FL=1
MERKAEYCLTQIFHYLVNGLAAIVFFCCIAYSGYALWDNWSILKEPDQVREDLIRYKPANEEELSYSFQELKAMNPDVCGWLTLDHTKIDYPVVQGTDNFEYLEKDVLGNPSVAGSIFLDAKSDRNFHDFYTVIMGHHMQGRKMFGDIDLYTDASFFEKNTTGTLYVEGRILKLETVAILKADAYDKYVYRTDWKEKEEKEAEVGLGHLQELTVRPISIEVRNESVDGIRIKELRPLLNRKFVISRIKHREGGETELVNSETILHVGDIILVISTPIDVEAITVFFGKEIKMEWEQLNKELISRRILITKPELNGKTLSQLKIRNNFGANITRVNRSGVDLVASPQLQLQMGDRVTIVGSELAVTHAEKVLGNSMKRLNHPNLIPIFIGIALGCILGSLPFAFPGIPQPVKLGLAGGPLIVSILISRFGPKYKLITYTTMSANLMLREIGISIFLACVGLGAGEGFVDTVIHGGGYIWVGYGVIITILPLLITGLVGRYYCKLNYFTLIGVLAGSNTNPPALAYSNDLTSCDAPAVGYATVYPLTMFLRVLTAQILILSLG